MGKILCEDFDNAEHQKESHIRFETDLTGDVRNRNIASSVIDFSEY